MLTLILHTGYAHSKLLTIIYKDQMGQYWRTSLLLCLITVVHFLVAPPEKLQKRYIKRKKKWGEKFIPCKRKGCVYQTSPKESLGFVVSYTESNSLTSKTLLTPFSVMSLNENTIQSTCSALSCLMLNICTKKQR